MTARGTNDELRNSHFAALRVKDALCDRMLEVEGRRPNVDTDDPDARISLTLRGNRASIQLDLSGDPLFKRLPRRPRERTPRTSCAPTTQRSPAPRAIGKRSARPHSLILKTRCAMTIPPRRPTARRSGQRQRASRWQRSGRLHRRAPHSHAPRPDRRLLRGRRRGARGRSILATAHPVSSAGTGASRAGLSTTLPHGANSSTPIAAPSLQRPRRPHRRHRPVRGRRRLRAPHPQGRRSRRPRASIFAQPDLDKISRKLMMPACCGGEPRGFVFLDTTETAISKMSRVLDLATSLHAGACGADPVRAMLSTMPTVALTRDDLLIRTLGEPARSLRVMPNNEEAELAVFSAANGAISAGEGNVAAEDSMPAEDAVESSVAPSPATTLIDLGDGKPCPILIPESEQFARRLRKVAKLRRKWAQREGVTCYRVYDADLPKDFFRGHRPVRGQRHNARALARHRRIRRTSRGRSRPGPRRACSTSSHSPRVSCRSTPTTSLPRRASARAAALSDGKQAGGTSPSGQHGKGGKPRGGRGLGIQPPQPGRGFGHPERYPHPQAPPHRGERPFAFAVNFNDYLDTGIFLDHRITRGRARARPRQAFLSQPVRLHRHRDLLCGRCRRGEDRHRRPLQHLPGLGRAQHGAKRLCRPRPSLRARRRYELDPRHETDPQPLGP